MPRKITPAILNIMKSLYVNDQLSTDEIAQKFNCSHGTVAYWLGKEGVIRTQSEGIKIALSKSQSPWLKVREKDLPLIKDLYLNKKLSSFQIAEKFNCSPTNIQSYLRRMGCTRNWSEANKMAIAQGRLKFHPKEKIIGSGGYVYIRKPGHPRTTQDGYVLEHIVVWEEHHKKSLPEGWQIHHLNGITNDNRPSNLVALPPAKHRAKHANLLSERAKRIRELEIDNRQLRKSLEDSQSIFYVNEN